MLAIATTRPVRASSTTVAAESATYGLPLVGEVCERARFTALSSSRSATAWIRASIEVTRWSPLTGGLVARVDCACPRMSTATCVTPALPRR